MFFDKINEFELLFSTGGVKVIKIKNNQLLE